jgi:hypothetical protein
MNALRPKAGVPVLISSLDYPAAADHKAITEKPNARDQNQATNTSKVQS